VLTPTRADPFALNRQSGVADEGESYREVMKRGELEREEERVRRAVAEKEATMEVVHHKAALLKCGDRITE
jgi:splicing factor 3B subunit 1